ncbi:MAG: DUF4293 domain-containing protein [Bacteroidales bacterium]|nr:DUF4293 domain-containing protein [Bacteroidales bacterium]
MLQRIQTLYLLLALLANSLLFSFPLVMLLNSQQVYTMGITGVFANGETVSATSDFLPLTMLVAAISSVILAAIFFFNNRPAQIRLGVFGLLLSLGCIGLMYFYSIKFTALLAAQDKVYKLGFVLPAIVAILLFLAIKAIRKDEMLIRSIDRIR